MSTSLATASPRVLRPATVAESGGPATGAPSPLSPLGLAVVLIGVLLPVTDFFIVNVALPSMARDLHASSALLELVIVGYATSYAVLLVLGGRLGDTYGRRRLFLTGMAGFTVASLACGLAPTVGILVVARVLQGAAAALMVPQTLSTIQASGDLAARAKGIAWYGATAGIGAVAGQVLGGVLVSVDIAHAGWRPIFLVNVPVGVVGLVLAARYVPETGGGRRSHLDWQGSLLLGAALVAVLVPLTEGRALAWPAWSWAMLAAAPVLAGSFVVVERRLERSGRMPLLPPEVMAHRTMRRGLAMMCPFFGGFAAFMFVYALMTQGSLGYSPLEAGLALAPLAVAFLITSLSMPRLVARWGHTVIVAGSVLQLAGLAGLALTLASAWPHVDPLALAPALVVIGAGQGLVMPALFRVVLSDVPVAQAGAGSGILATSQQVSLALGVATLGSLYVTLEPVARLGVEGAVLVVLAVQGAIAIGVAVAATRLAAR